MLFSARHRIAMFVCPELAWIIASCRSEIRALNTANAQIVEERDQALQSEPSLDHELRKRLLALAACYSRHFNHTLATVSLRAAKRGSFFDELAAGGNFTVKRAERIIQWFSDNWPNGELAWPTDIPRPSPTKKDAA